MALPEAVVGSSCKPKLTGLSSSLIPAVKKGVPGSTEEFIPDYPFQAPAGKLLGQVSHQDFKVAYAHIDIAHRYARSQQRIITFQPPAMNVIYVHHKNSQMW